MTFEEMERAMDRQQQYGREIDQRIAALLQASENHERRFTEQAEQDKLVHSWLADVDERIAALLKSVQDHEIWRGQWEERIHKRFEERDERIYRRWEELDARFEETDDRMRRRGEALDQRINVLVDQMQVMRAAMTSLFEHMERFIRGLEGNGWHRGEQA